MDSLYKFVSIAAAKTPPKSVCTATANYKPAQRRVDRLGSWENDVYTRVLSRLPAVMLGSHAVNTEMLQGELGPELSSSIIPEEPFPNFSTCVDLVGRNQIVH